MVMTCSGSSVAQSSPDAAPAAALDMEHREEPTVTTLKSRRDFLRVAQGHRVPCPGFLLQARRQVAQDGPARVGFTCSKKIGNAVTRNRAKRRLREIARAVLPQAGQAGWDYVLVGRPGTTVLRDFKAMRGDLERALRRVHGKDPL